MADEPRFAVGWRTLSADEARWFAQVLEACLPVELAVEAIDPEIQIEVRAELGRRWEQDARVRAARFDLRTWVAKSSDERRRSALEKTRNGMAAFLAVRNMAEIKDTELTKALKFMEALERVEAGTAGQGDALSAFWERFAKVAKESKAKEQTH